MHIEEGGRIFLNDSSSFGSVTKTSIFGKTSGTVVLSDDGSMRAFFGEKVNSEITNTETKKDGYGIEHVVPETDVKFIGPAVLAGEGLDEITQIALFQKFMALPVEERLLKTEQWTLASEDVENKQFYLQEIFEILEDDSPFIKKQSAKLLSSLDDELKALMLQKLYELTTAESRKLLIVRFFNIQNNRIEKEVFVQDLYKLVLDDDTYLRIEFKKYGLRIKKMDPIVLSEKIESFITLSTSEEKLSTIETWRNKKYFNHKFGPRFVEIVLSKY